MEVAMDLISAGLLVAAGFGLAVFVVAVVGVLVCEGFKRFWWGEE